MMMRGTILSVKMNEFFSGLDANVFDADEEQTYKAQIVGGVPGLAELLALKKQAMKSGGVTDQQLADAANQVQSPPVMQQLAIRVQRVKVNKAGFMTLICDLTQ